MLTERLDPLQVQEGVREPWADDTAEQEQESGAGGFLCPVSSVL